MMTSEEQAIDNVLTYQAYCEAVQADRRHSGNWCGWCGADTLADICDDCRAADENEGYSWDKIARADALIDEALEGWDCESVCTIADQGQQPAQRSHRLTAGQPSIAPIQSQGASIDNAVQGHTESQEDCTIVQ